MVSTQKGNEDNCDVAKLWQLILLCLQQKMINTKTTIRTDFRDRCP